MATFRSLDAIAQAMLDYLRILQPDLDSKPGSVSRDLFIDLPAAELAKLYVELKNVSNLQSLSSAQGSDLKKLARNFGLQKNQGAKATGTVVLTLNSLISSVSIRQGTVITARNGANFQTTSDAQFDVLKSNVYRANAIRMRNDLSLAGINDEFALEVSVEAISAGTSGNIGKYGIVSRSIAGVSNVININSFSGGTAEETDDQFKARILSVFSGANIGTAKGYENALLADGRVSDVLTVEPGDTLMTRDGTIVENNSAGDPVIVSSGTGGKVDIYVQGAAVEENTESYIYRDLSGRSDPTSIKNDYILGQRSINPYLDYQQKRRLLLDAGTLPFQPAQSVVSLSGSLSGANFVEKFVDSDGITKGNFELVKDTGAFGGSVFGFDKIHFISNNITLEDQAGVKGILNGQDALDFTDVSSISAAYENVAVGNENSSVSASDRSLITLAHTPVIAVDRVINLTTGERYSVVDQNPDGESGQLNTTGRIKISGGSLPSTNHVLQVSYLWKNIFYAGLDYDPLNIDNSLRTAQDSIDWGFANRVSGESSTILYTAEDGYHVITEMPISRVVNVNELVEESKLNILGKVVVDFPITNIVSVKDSAGAEVYYTNKSDGSFSGFEVTLPTDSLLANSDLNDIPDGYVFATVRYNSQDLFSPDGYDTGSFSGHIIYLTGSGLVAGAPVYVDYVADVSTLLPSTSLASFPVLGSQNAFTQGNSVLGAQPLYNLYDGYGAITENLRYSPTYLKMNFTGTSAVGRMLVKGYSFHKIDQVVTVLRDGLSLDLSEAIKQHFSTTTVPSSYRIASVESIARVSLNDAGFPVSDFDFDVLNVGQKHVDYSNGKALANSSLSATTIALRDTEYNLAESPSTGEKLRVVFYLIDTNATERVTVSANGFVVTKNKYAFVEKVSVDSGFVGLSGSIEGSLGISSYTQPAPAAQYFVTYNYVAPKEGERLTIKYRYNKLISELINVLEDVRPITADVLLKAAEAKAIDVTVSVVPTVSFANNTTNLQQSVLDAITNFLSSQNLNATIDYSDLINNIYAVAGVDRVVLTQFNVAGSSGVVKSIYAERSQYLTAGTLTVNIESR